MKQLAMIQGGVWRTRPIDEVPEIALSSWRVYELEDGDRHFVGVNESEGGAGRVSSKIVVFDPETMQGITQSGRVYSLIGPSGHNGDADYTWNRWKGINKITSAKDVSENIGDEAE